ncbi:unnamed protein product [Effrenium voratum]|uniref:Cyclin-dependent kinase 2 homolog n=1 Tax=Effrenium voratum TaxID=2562239 RepID=A0AA36N007_9DINO|nr:unnamed protein product [Effrenium voratum]
MLDVNDDFDQLERRFEQQYEVTEPKVLGEGTYGKVYKAVRRQNGQVVAIKRIKLNPDDDEGIPSTALREVAVLKELDSEFVVKLFEVFCSPNKLVLVFELMENDLRKYMKSVKGVLQPRDIKSLCWQLVKGLEVCHARRIIHRDIKPQNLLIDHHLRLKLADFGLARAFVVPVPKYTHEVVTVWYRAPEILLGSSIYSIGVDMWAVGCVFAEMATGSPLFAGDSEIDTIFKIFQKLGTPTDDVWPDIRELPNFKPNFPSWRPKGWQNIRNTKTQVGENGIDLLEKFMAYDPKQRWPSPEPCGFEQSGVPLVAREMRNAVKHRFEGRRAMGLQPKLAESMQATTVARIDKGDMLLLCNPARRGRSGESESTASPRDEPLLWNPLLLDAHELLPGHNIELSWDPIGLRVLQHDCEESATEPGLDFLGKPPGLEECAEGPDFMQDFWSRSTTAGTTDSCNDPVANDILASEIASVLYMMQTGKRTAPWVADSVKQRTRLQVRGSPFWPSPGNLFTFGPGQAHFCTWCGSARMVYHRFCPHCGVA